MMILLFFLHAHSVEEYQVELNNKKIAKIWNWPQVAEVRLVACRHSKERKLLKTIALKVG